MSEGRAHPCGLAVGKLLRAAASRHRTASADDSPSNVEAVVAADSVPVPPQGDRAGYRRRARARRSLLTSHAGSTVAGNIAINCLLGWHALTGTESPAITSSRPRPLDQCANRIGSGTPASIVLVAPPTIKSRMRE